MNGVLAFLRILFILNGLMNTLVYLFVSSEADLVVVMKLWQPNLVAAFYMISSALHIQGLSQLCCARKPKETAPEDKWRITIMFSSLEKWCEKYYDYFLVGRELVEIPIWTVQCFYFGQQSSDQESIVLFSLVLALECFLTPLIMKNVSNPIRRLILVEISDVTYDFLMGVLIPTLPFIKVVAEILMNGFVLSDALFNTRGLNAALLFFIGSPFDLISRVVLPFLMSHIILADITSRVKRALHETKHKKNKVAVAIGAHLPNEVNSSIIVPVQSFRLTAVKRLLSFVSPAWGVAVLGVTIGGIANTSICDGVACSVRTYPWTYFSPPMCPCLAGGFDCKLQEIPTDAEGFSQQLVSSFSPKIMSLFWIYHCPITLLPDEMANFQNLGFLHMYNTSLTNFNIPVDQFPHLKNLLLQSAGNLGPTLPTTLEKFGPAMVSVLLRNVHIKTLPSNFSESWKSQTRWLNLRGNELTHFPLQLNQLESLIFCDLGSTSLQAIPSNFTHANLQLLYVDGNALTTVPGTLLQQFPKLTEIRMDQNNIVGLSHVNISQAQLEKMTRFTFAGNPVCSASDQPWNEWHFDSTIFGCDDPGSIECAPGCFADRLGDYRCDYECDVPECKYDNGDCQYLQRNTHLNQIIASNKP